MSLQYSLYLKNISLTIPPLRWSKSPSFLPWTASMAPNWSPCFHVAHPWGHCLWSCPQKKLLTLSSYSVEGRRDLERMDEIWRHWHGLMISKMCMCLNICMYWYTCGYGDTHTHTHTLPGSICWKNPGAMTLSVKKMSTFSNQNLTSDTTSTQRNHGSQRNDCFLGWGKGNTVRYNFSIDVKN